MKYFKNTYFTNNFYRALGLVVFLFLNTLWLPAFYVIGLCCLWLLLLLVAFELFWLYRIEQGLFANRICADRFSNGDSNPVDLFIENRYPAKVNLELLEELPAQFQIRNQQFAFALNAGEEKRLSYELTPKKRGPYHFGHAQVFASAFLNLVQRRYRLAEEQEVAVFPSFVQMRHYELLAVSNQLITPGIKKIRRIGNNQEFEQIEKYVPGDDYRKINWKATARRNKLMVNHYQDERSQNVISVIDKGRSMKMPFEGMTLLDYAINASLVISNIAMRKGDRAGLLTYQHKINGAVLPSNRNAHLSRLMEQLYREKTTYTESDVKQVYSWLRYNVNQRSLVLLYTNFESHYSMRRQLRYLQLINRNHLLVVVFFVNSEIEKLLHEKTENLEEIYTKGLAEQLVLEKTQIAHELQRHGIQTILTKPAELNVNTINKYLELKARGMI